MTEFDFEGVFDEDYLYFYEEILTPERTQEDVEKILELLEPAPGAEILDCPCGHGRIASVLADRGFRVTGLDASELFLERARADASERGVEVEYVHGDMRDLPWRERFDGLVNWFTSFGYFSDDENKAVLREFHDALRPGGRLVLETQSISRILLSPRPQHWVEHDVDLLVPAGALVVVADHLDAGPGRAVDIDTERRQLEVVLNRPPVDTFVVDRRDRVDGRHRVGSH